jgi:hypothetical protein
MPRKPKQNKLGADPARFHKLLKQIVNMMLGTVEEALGTTPWTFAFILERQAGVDSEVRAGKLRVQVPGEAELKWLRQPLEYAHLMSELWKLKTEIFPKPWYAMKLTFYPDGKFETEYDYNPDCPEDFFAT